MTRRMLIAAALAAVVGGGSPDATGEWLVVATFDPASAGDSAGRRVELVCSFEQHDGTIAGSCRPADGPEGVDASGTVKDDTIEWSFQISPSASAPKQTATFKGALQSGAPGMKGTFTLGALRGDFEATRQ